MQYSKNFEMSHIVNQKNIISTSVIANTVEEADVYATALFTSDEIHRKKIIESNKKIKIITIDKMNNLKTYNNFNNLVCLR